MDLKLRFSDTELLDFLQKENDREAYTGKCEFRLSTTGRGWRLHETSGGGFHDVRTAIAFAKAQSDRATETA